MALGLTGHLSNLAIMNVHNYLSKVTVLNLADSATLGEVNECNPGANYIHDSTSRHSSVVSSYNFHYSGSSK